MLTELRGKPLECESIHHVECPCIFGLLHEDKRERYSNIIERWQQAVSKVSNMDEFNKEVIVDHFNACRRTFNKYDHRTSL